MSILLRRLLEVPPERLAEIGRDYSFVGTHRAVAVSLADYFRMYGLGWAEIAARYEL